MTTIQPISWRSTADPSKQIQPKFGSSSGSTPTVDVVVFEQRQRISKNAQGLFKLVIKYVPLFEASLRELFDVQGPNTLQRLNITDQAKVNKFIDTLFPLFEQIEAEQDFETRKKQAFKVVSAMETFYNDFNAQNRGVPRELLSVIEASLEMTVKLTASAKLAPGEDWLHGKGVLQEYLQSLLKNKTINQDCYDELSKLFEILSPVDNIATKLKNKEEVYLNDFLAATAAIQDKGFEKMPFKTEAERNACKAFVKDLQAAALSGLFLVDMNAEQISKFNGFIQEQNKLKTATDLATCIRAKSAEFEKLGFTAYDRHKIEKTLKLMDTDPESLEDRLSGVMSRSIACGWKHRKGTEMPTVKRYALELAIDKVLDVIRQVFPKKQPAEALQA